MSTVPTRNVEPEVPKSAASMGKSVIVKGQIISREDLYLDGEIEGTVECPEHRLTAGPNAKLQASIKAREIVILGTVHGNIEAGDKVEIRKNARLVGDIQTARITIEDGAYFKGSIDIVKAEAPPRPAVTAPSPVSVRPTGNATPAPLVTGAAEGKR